MKTSARFFAALLSILFVSDGWLLPHANAQISNCVPAPSGLIGIWRGDGNTLDGAGINNGATPFGIAYATGVVGQAFDFDSSYRRVSIPDSPTFRLTNSFTIEGWVYPRQYNTGFIFFRGDNRGGLDAWTLDMYQAGYLNFQIDDAANNYASVLAPIAINQWQHIVATLDGGTGDMKVYINGVLVGQTNTTVRPIGDLDPANDPAVGIGNHGGTFHQFPFNGLIDEISLYSRALSQSEVQSIYNAVSGGKCDAGTTSVPTISSVSPFIAPQNALVTINGSNFSSVPASNIVYFGAVRASVQTASPSQLSVTVPSGATFAPVTINVNGRIAYSPKPFEPTFNGKGTNINAGLFAAGINLPTGNGSARVVIADLDGDGKPDLAVANGGAHTVSLYRNVGTNGVLDANSFAPRVDLAAAAEDSSPYKVEVADVDGDGKLDLLTVNRPSNTISVFRNVASPGSLTAASFMARVEFTVGNLPLAVAVRDLDADGRPEIITANYNSGSVSVLKNIGTPGSITSASFAPAVDFAVGAGTANLTCDDLDGDGKPDLAVVNFADTVLSILRNTAASGVISSNSFAPKVDLPTPFKCEAITTGDVDGDGKLDIVFASSESGQMVCVYRNISTLGSLAVNSFEPRVDFPAGGWTHTVTLSDLNGDSKPDVVAVSEINSHLLVFQNAAQPGSFTSNSLLSRVDFTSGWNPWGVSAGDLDGDGRPDVALCNTYDGTLTLYRNVISVSDLSSSCSPTPSGLVSLWKGEGNTMDSAGANHGMIVGNLAYGMGEVNQAFVFDGTTASITIPQSASLNVQSFTIETWINPADVSSQVPIAEYAADTGWSGVHFWISVPLGGGPGCLFANVRSLSTGLDQNIISSAPGLIKSNEWSHVAVTFDQASGLAHLYLNGTNVASKSLGSIVPNTALPLNIGLRPATGPEGGAGTRFPGKIDELSLYNRALGASEIHAIFNAGSGGKCPVSPAVPYLIDVDFGAGTTGTTKAGLAAIGYSTNDFWNFYTRDTADGGWLTFGALSDLKLVDGSSTSVGITVANAPGMWGNGSTDPMYYSYIYPFDGGNVTITITNLPNGVYDLLPYCFDGNYEVTVGNVSYGTRITHEIPVVNPPIWTEGVQYAVFSNVVVSAGQPVVLTVHPGVESYAVISGLQILQRGTMIPIAPSIISQPTNRTVYVGGSATFSVTATGDAPLGYQWRFNGDNLIGKTGASLTIANVQLSNAGEYSVIVTNPVGSVTSLVATLTVNLPPPCTPPPSGLISWWRFENSTLDNWDSNNGTTPVGALYAAGKAGNAFNSANSRYVLIPDAPSLGLTNGLTLEAWVNPVVVGTPNLTPRTIIAKSDYPNYDPYRNQQSSFYLGISNNLLYFSVTRTGSIRTNTTIVVPQPLVSNQWSHVVATYDGAKLRVYVNGIPVVQTNYAGGIFAGSANLTIGALQLSPTSTSPVWPFNGLIDEVSIYNRALADDEIQSIYSSDFIGKCLVAPTISTQPQSRVIPQGEDVMFGVSVIGSRPLRYQWRFMGLPLPPGGNVWQNLPGATNATLLLEKVQSNRIGYYSVVVTNAMGTIISSNALLTLSAPLSCVSTPTNIISWWTGDSNVLDAVDGNSALVFSPPLYSTGKVGAAFSFNGISSRVQVNNSASLNFSNNVNFSIECWIKAYLTNSLLYTNVVILEKRSPGTPGSGYSLGLNQGRLAFWLGTYPGGPNYSAMFNSTGPDLRDGMFHHVAVIVDRTSTNSAKLLVDGQVVLTFDASSRAGDLSNTYPLVMGAPYLTSTSGLFYGLIDEVAMYRRALSIDEVQAIAGAGSAGRCKEKPYIITQPVSVKVNYGSNAVFRVEAGGAATLRYQWRLNGGTLFGATNAAYTNRSATTPATYSVMVSNVFGSVISSNALLTINHPPIANGRNLTLLEDTNAPVLLTGFDSDNDPITYFIATGPLHGSLSGVPPNLVYTPNHDYFGKDSFTFKANDGMLDSLPATVNITILPVEDAPVAQSQSVAVDEDNALAVTLGAYDVDGDPLIFSINGVSQTTLDLPTAHGRLSGYPPNIVYTPNTNYFGPDSFTFKVNDGQLDSALATVSITVRPVNDAPVASISVTPLFDFLGITNLIAIAPDNTQARLILDGSQSHDIENDPLTYLWQDGTNQISSAVTFTNAFEVGTHDFTLQVSDGALAGTDAKTVEVITPAQALSFLLDQIENSSISRNGRRPLIASVKSAAAAFEREQFRAGTSQLQAFQNKVRAQVAPSDAVLAEQLINTAQTIVNAVDGQ